MRLRVLSRFLVAAVLGGCAPRGHVEPPAPPAPTPLHEAAPYRFVRVADVIRRHVRFPEGTLGAYLRQAHCTNCFDVVFGPPPNEACAVAGARCQAPIDAKDPNRHRLLRLDADRAFAAVPWSSLAPIATAAAAQLGERHPDVQVLRALAAGGALPNQVWFRVGAGGGFDRLDGYPPELAVDGAQIPIDRGIRPLAPMLGVARHDLRSLIEVVQLAPDRASPIERALVAAATQPDAPGLEFDRVVVRVLADGAFLVTFASGEECTFSGGTLTRVVAPDGDVAPVDVHQTHNSPPNHCYNRGRRPAGLRSWPAPVADARAAFLAEAHHLEAASVPAFERLATELDALGAPARLVRAARAAARDERRHAAMMLALDARATPVEVAAPAPREPRTIALENAVEGCVHEAFAAIVCDYQAARAEDPAVAAAMRAIAGDEHRHASLAAAVAAWLEPRLSGVDRAAVARAVDQALDALPARAARESARFAAAAAPLGLPPPAHAHALATGFVAYVRATRGHSTVT